MSRVAAKAMSKREKLEAELERAEDDLRDAERAFDDAEEAVEEIKADLKALGDEPEEAPLRVVVPELVKAGWSIDISANAIAEREREAAGKVAP